MRTNSLSTTFFLVGKGNEHELMSKNKELLQTIKECKVNYIGNVIRGERNELLRLIVEVKVEGKISVGRRNS